MSNPSQSRLERALAELHQHRPSGQISVITLQLDHPALPEPVRVVADNIDLDARLEDDSLVTFTALAFRAAGPGSGESRWPEISLRLDGASHIIEPELEVALGEDAPIIVTFREYIRDLALDGPARVITGLELDNTRTGDLEVSGTAGFYGLDKRFGKTYDPSDFPGIS